MSEPLLISTVIQHADRYFPDKEIVSRRVEGDIHRYTYSDCHRRARRIAKALRRLGMRMGDCMATIAWNGYRHLELYYAISGTGAVIHTINPRLHIDQLAYIVNHAEDKYVFFDLTFTKLIEELAPRCGSMRGYIALCDRADLPRDSNIPNLLCYEDLLAAEDDDFEWPEFDENTASGLCYTSGTTGNPKGVLYSHRSTLLHTYASIMPDAFNLSEREVVMPVVPMFHVNAWGLPYSALVVGAKFVCVGPHADGESLYALMEQEQVTLAAGVPTIWHGLLDYVSKGGHRFSTLKRGLSGGSACPPALVNEFHERYGVELLQSWGMTEMSPLGTTGSLRSHHLALPPEQQAAVRRKQGHVTFGVNMKVVDDAGRELPFDGKSVGMLMVKGGWVLNRYFKAEESALQDGWFPTGDLATIDADRFMQITDRSKDVIKSGGEWIGSIDIENIAMSHPAVRQAACIAAHHPKWDERPLLIVSLKEGCEVSRTDLIAYYEGKIAKWWTPDDVVFVDSLPVGGTGKILKNEIRNQFKDYKLPTV